MPSTRSLSLAALACAVPALVQGIAFTSPAASSIVTKGSEITVDWTSVDTDPSVFSLYIWNFVEWPPYYEALEYGVDTASGETTVRIPCHVDNGAGWQLTAINDTNVYVLYAQTDKFNITGDSCTDPSSTSSCYAATSTVYVTQTAATGYSEATTSASSSTITASVIQPGVVYGTATSAPAVSTTTACVEDADVSIEI